MHIALVNQWYPPETGGGGVATHNYNFARACVSLGHTVTVIAARNNHQTPFRQEQEGVIVFRILAPNLYRLRRLPIVGKYYRTVQALIYSAMACKLLGDINKHSPVDVAEFADVNAEAIFWRKGLSRKLAVRCHAPNFVLSDYYSRIEQPFESHFLGLLEKKAIRKAHLVTAPSHDLARVIGASCSLPITDIHVIPNAVNPSPPSERTNWEEVINILFVGRLERLKGIEVLIEAIPHVIEELPSARFLIVGPSRNKSEGLTYRTHIEERLSNFIDNGKVCLLGFLSGTELIECYANSHISVVPSLYESFSYTAADAMMHGLAVIGSRVGGITETLNYGRCGILIEANSYRELVDAILRLAHDRDKRDELGNAAQHFALTHFSAEHVTERIVNVYSTLTRDDKAPS